MILCWGWEKRGLADPRKDSAPRRSEARLEDKPRRSELGGSKATKKACSRGADAQAEFGGFEEGTHFREVLRRTQPNRSFEGRVDLEVTRSQNS